MSSAFPSGTAELLNKGAERGPLSCLNYLRLGALQHLEQGRSERRGGRRNTDARGLHRGDLVVCPTLAAGDDRARVTHAPPWRRGASRDEADHRLLGW